MAKAEIVQGATGAIWRACWRFQDESHPYETDDAPFWRPELLSDPWKRWQCDEGENDDVEIKDIQNKRRLSQ
jgi:hypothetical protein